MRTLLFALVLSFLVPSGICQPTSSKTRCVQCCGRHSTIKERRIAFSAARTSSMTSNQFVDIIVYDHVFTNVGNGYNPLTGIFTCPVSGYYFFTFNALKHVNSNLHIQLTKNNEQIIAAHSGMASGDSGPEEIQQTGNDVIIPCNKGDQVWMKLPYAESKPFFLFSHPGHKYASFSGYMLFTAD
ncbi:caprin-2-like [Glandiceps talaboti]